MLNETLTSLIEQFGATTQSVIGYLQVFAGGLVGLYLLVIFMRMYELHKMRKFMKEIRSEMSSLRGLLEDGQSKKKNN